MYSKACNERLGTYLIVAVVDRRDVKVELQSVPSKSGKSTKIAWVASVGTTTGVSKFPVNPKVAPFPLTDVRSW